MRIGLIAMSAKPFHAGHDGLVRMAAGECDAVHLYVSLSDRKRPGEIPILGSDMQIIWTRYIEPTLPKNVTVHYGGSPVANIYKELDESQDADDTFVIYSDPVDLDHNFSVAALEKWAGALWERGQIVRQPIQRTSTVNVSGTKMREYIASHDKASFLANMPHEVDGEAIWNVLQRSVNASQASPTKRRKKTSIGEGLIRNYVAAFTGRMGS